MFFATRAEQFEGKLEPNREFVQLEWINILDVLNSCRTMDVTEFFLKEATAEMLGQHDRTFASLDGKRLYPLFTYRSGKAQIGMRRIG